LYTIFFWVVVSMLGYSIRAGRAPPATVEYPGSFTAKQVCATLHTCDLVFFSGRSWTSWLTRLVTQSEFSHVALVDREPTSGICFLWESVLQPETDVIDIFTQSSAKRGVRLVEASQTIQSYGLRNKTQEFRIGVLRFHIDRALTPESVGRLQLEIYTRLQQFEDQEHPKIFEQSPLNLVRAGMKDILGPNPELPTREYFCSNLVVATLQHIGLMDKKYNPNEATPASLAHHPDRVPLLDGFRLGPELEVYTIRLDPPLDGKAAAATMPTTSRTQC
jgi:hypothetical protein